MMDLINWSNLKPYKSTQNKCFEELCFQICMEEFNSKGDFVRIDDSGGGDGVEFYLLLPNGDIWGWQCKFFGRFSEGGRQEQIKKSIATAYRKHGNKLKKWILCSQNSLTNQEKKWFDSIPSLQYKGSEIVPQSDSVFLEHWGDSTILNYLRKHPSIYKFFFTEKILDDEWFKGKFDLVYSSNVIRTKYLDNLHTKGEVDDFVSRHLGGVELVDLIKKAEIKIDLLQFQKEFNIGVKKITERKNEYEFKEIYDEINLFLGLNSYHSIINDGVELLKEIKLFLLENNYRLSEVLQIKIQVYKIHFREFFDLYTNYKDIKKLKSVHWDNEENEEDKGQKYKIKECRNTLLGPYFTIRNYDYFLNVFDECSLLKSNEMHIGGNASKGKTHISVNIIKKQIEKGKPGIFVFGKNFTTNLHLKEQLRSILDLPASWSITDFLGALNICGRVHNTKAILLIDGLNEAINWKTIWGDSLEELINEINTSFPNVLLITTFRTSYKEQLFPTDYFNYINENNHRLVEIYGFSNENINEAINKYFNHYKITLENSSTAIKAFEEPLFLKLFCQTKQGRTVSFQNEDLFDVFEEYLKKCSGSILEKLRLDSRLYKTYVKNILGKLSKSLWDNNSREICLDYAIAYVLTQEELLIFEKEDLLIFRDWHNVEVITFTYDLLSGYLIAKKLLESIESTEELIKKVKSDEFKNKLLIRETYHPLFNDILRCFCVLAIKKFGFKFYTYGANEIMDEYMLKSIFEINRETIIENKDIVIQIVKENFTNNNKHKLIYNLFKTSELDFQSPLNLILLSDLLFEMKVSDRDLSWTEYIRINYGNYDKEYRNFLNRFTKACNSKMDYQTDKIHLVAKKTMWFLSTTNREFRDLSTRALYYYGRKYLDQFLELVKYSLSVNDPYIWERTLAALYGIVLAKHNIDINFREKTLPAIGISLFELIFKKGAPYSSTHIIARDYASKIVEIVLLHHSNLFSTKDINLTVAPFKFGGNRKPGEFDYTIGGGIYSEPISMDFSNYTIGSIVKDGHSYSNPPEKIKVRKQIYWRIYDLGWNEEQFNKIDGDIRSESYRSRSDQVDVERYGKKYSWIAYFEMAGLRSDDGLLKNDWNKFRFPNADIDPTFPLNSKSQKYVFNDYLGDRNLSLVEWCLNGGKPLIKEYLEVSCLNKKKGNWVCLDGVISQKDKKANREIFAFIRGVLVKEDDYDKFKVHLKNKDLGGRFLPDSGSNDYAFAGELYSIKNSTDENVFSISFETSRKKVTVQKGEEGYYPTPIVIEGVIELSYPKFIEIDELTSDDYDVLLPVMDYSWIYSQSVLNQASHETIVSKELAFFLKLTDRPQTFNLYDDDGNLASQNLQYTKSIDNNHKFTYLRKDLLDRFLAENNYKLLWSVWGERNVRFKNFDDSRKFYEDHKISDRQVFNDVIEYTESKK
ncbi:hypothetical protein [Flavobacterium sp. 7A]|uniref:hypothetical protein n=1 Tax=Flavobacterium sp. 7A TaxID=2940571 RepID=UPI00222749D4|nr:hypothetical protein [Flavobacterium sp. 7A]MCW2119713.1 hypothetical protein [Flavobacterium sp. 7A]